MNAKEFFVEAALTGLFCCIPYATYLLHVSAKRLRNIADDIDLIRSAAEGIEHNVGVIAAPISTRRGKRFRRLLRTKWPMIVQAIDKVLRRPRRLRLAPDMEVNTKAPIA